MCVTGNALAPYVYDPILMKLFITVLMLSTYLTVHHEKNLIENLNENFTRDILSVQNIYVELLWRYILSRCSNYKQSVKLLTSFITRILYSQMVQVKLDKFVRSVLPHQNQTLEPIMASVWDSD